MLQDLHLHVLHCPDAAFPKGSVNIRGFILKLMEGKNPCYATNGYKNLVQLCKTRWSKITIYYLEIRIFTEQLYVLTQVLFRTVNLFYGICVHHFYNCMLCTFNNYCTIIYLS